MHDFFYLKEGSKYEASSKSSRKYKGNKSIFGMFKNKIVSLKTLTLLSKTIKIV